MAGSRLRQRQPQPRGNSFFGGAAILAVGIAVVKIIGMFYKVPLYNIIGEQGVTDFTNAYNIYSVLLTASSASELQFSAPQENAAAGAGSTAPASGTASASG